MENNKKREINNDFQRTLRHSLFIVLFIMGVSATVLITVITTQINETIRSNSARLIAANVSQLQMNIDSYFDEVESTSALLFSDEKYYKYDATREGLSDYEKILYENAILDRIVDLGVMENFSDFTIVYANNSHIGWLSNGSKDQFGDEIYSILESKIVNANTSDGWFDGYDGHYDRMYYVKRLNKNAIALVSFYARELENAFSIPDELDSMTIRLVGDNGVILYSSNRQEIGNTLQDENIRQLSDKNETYFLDDNSLISTSQCNNGWHVICQMSMDSMLQTIRRFRGYTRFFGISLLVICGAMLTFGIKRMSNPLKKSISNLNERAENDGLTGLLNKVTFEGKVSSSLANRKNVAFVMIDVDHFKQVNDTKGHAYGDEVIARTANVLKKSLREDTIVGRLGGDEFAFLFSDNDLEIEDLKSIVIKRMDDIREAFNKEFSKEKSEIGISLSFGAYVALYDGEDFATVYEGADKALYTSKEAGRDCYTVFDKSMEVGK